MLSAAGEGTGAAAGRVGGTGRDVAVAVALPGRLLDEIIRDGTGGADGAAGDVGPAALTPEVGAFGAGGRGPGATPSAEEAAEDTGAVGPGTFDATVGEELATTVVASALAATFEPATVGEFWETASAAAGLSCWFGDDVAPSSAEEVVEAGDAEEAVPTADDAVTAADAAAESLVAGAVAAAVSDAGVVSADGPSTAAAFFFPPFTGVGSSG